MRRPAPPYGAKPVNQACAAAHAWFTGFAPYGGSGRRIAFAVIVEHAGYGGRAAAPIAGAIASAARELGIIQ